MRKWELRIYDHLDECTDVLAVFDTFQEAEEAALDQIYYTRGREIFCQDDFNERELREEIAMEDGSVLIYRVVPV